MTARRLLLHLGLFVATLFTTTATGALQRQESIFPLTSGLAFSIPLMAILLCHEFGHYIAARLHGVKASLPYFIPLPPGIGFLGTMGAVIAQEGTSDRRKLMDIGAAGPLAGLVVAIPVLLYGLSLSEVKPLVGIGTQEGNSLFYALMKFAIKGEWLPGEGRDVMLHPTALAGWGGLLVTMLNLIPIGQLDGGHIATAYFGNRYERVAARLHRGLLVLAAAVFAWVFVDARQALGGRLDTGETLMIALSPAMAWLVWYGVLRLFRRMARGRYHPPVDDDRPLPLSRIVVFWVTAVAFVGIFMPVPLRMSIGAPEPVQAAPR